MTRLTKEIATKKANELLALVKKVLPDAEIRVWENISWHYCVTNGYITVNCDNKGNYFSFISQNKDGKSASAMWHGENRSKSPITSISLALKDFQLFCNKIKKTEEEIKSTVNFEEVELTEISPEENNQQVILDGWEIIPKSECIGPKPDKYAVWVDGKWVIHTNSADGWSICWNYKLKYIRPLKKDNI